MIDINSRTLQLCVAGAEAEFDRRIEDARRLYQQAWETAVDDFDACVAAHYLGYIESDSHKALAWHVEALVRAERSGDPRVGEFYGSLYVNLGHAHEQIGNEGEARRYYELAAERGIVHRGE